MEGHDTPKISVIYGTNREIAVCFWCPRPATYTRMGVGFAPNLRAVCGEAVRAAQRAGGDGQTPVHCATDRAAFPASWELKKARVCPNKIIIDNGAIGPIIKLSQQTSSDPTPAGSWLSEEIKMVFRTSTVWQMSTDELVAHLAALTAPDSIYWDARSLKKDGKKFTSLSWNHFPKPQKTVDGWVFVSAPAPTAAAEPKDILPDWETAGRTDGLGAKISIGGESFWVTVMRVETDGRVVGKVNNDLVCTEVHGLRLNDLVRYTPAAAASQPLAAAVNTSKPTPPVQAKLVDLETVRSAVETARDDVLSWLNSGATHPAPPPVQTAKELSGAGWAQFTKTAKLMDAE